MWNILYGERNLYKHAAQILACTGRFEEALPYAQRAYDYFVTDTVEPSLVIYIDGVLAYIYQGMGYYEQAMKYTDTEAIARLEEKLTCAQNRKAADLPFLIMWP